ncbi:MAG: fused MFS/spermidine synthase [Atopobiaceae bacterium]|nr:fused MFS/spermidine synthase [Atopobiaceae bacterium]
MSLLDRLFGENDDTNYADVKTMFGRAQVYDVETDEGDLLRVLDIAGSWQSASYVDERWSNLAFGYHRLFDRAFLAPIEIRSALMLGGGALSYPKHVVVQTQADVEVVEIDPQVIELARTWFFLDRLTPEQKGRLRVTCADAIDFLREVSSQGRRFDLVVNDLFAAELPTAELMEPEGAELVRNVLSDEGIYVVNVVSALEGRKARPLHKVKGALDSVFSQVEVLPLGADDPRTPDNNVVFATNGRYELSAFLGTSL